MHTTSNLLLPPPDTHDLDGAGDPNLSGITPPLPMNFVRPSNPYRKTYAVMRGTKVGVSPHWSVASNLVAGVPNGNQQSATTFDGAINLYSVALSEGCVEILERTPFSPPSPLRKKRRVSAVPNTPTGPPQSSSLSVQASSQSSLSAQASSQSFLSVQGSSIPRVAPVSIASSFTLAPPHSPTVNLSCQVAKLGPYTQAAARSTTPSVFIQIPPLPSQLSQASTTPRKAKRPAESPIPSPTPSPFYRNTPRGTNADPIYVSSVSITRETTTTTTQRTLAVTPSRTGNTTARQFLIPFGVAATATTTSPNLARTLFGPQPAPQPALSPSRRSTQPSASSSTLFGPQLGLSPSGRRTQASAATPVVFSPARRSVIVYISSDSEDESSISDTLLEAPTRPPTPVYHNPYITTSSQVAERSDSPDYDGQFSDFEGIALEELDALLATPQSRSRSASSTPLVFPASPPT